MSCLLMLSAFAIRHKAQGEYEFALRERERYTRLKNRYNVTMPNIKKHILLKRSVKDHPILKNIKIKRGK